MIFKEQTMNRTIGGCLCGWLVVMAASCSTTRTGGEVK